MGRHTFNTLSLGELWDVFFFPENSLMPPDSFVQHFKAILFTTLVSVLCYFVCHCYFLEVNFN